MKKQFFHLYAILGVTALPATVIENVWDGPSLGGQWSNAINWSQDVVPNNNAIDQYEVQIPTGNDVLYETTATVNSLAVASDSSVQIQNARTLTIAADGITGPGTVILNSTGNLTQLYASGSTPMVLSGGGKIELLGTSSSNRISAASTSGWFNTDYTISGAGTLIANSGSFVNQASIIANNSANNLIIDPSNLGMVNTGNMSAANGATLQIQNGSVDNTNGLIFTDATSTVFLTGATVFNGQFNQGDSGTLALSTSTLNGVTVNNSNTGNIDVSATSTIDGGVLNNPLGGAINIDQGDSLRISNSTTINNAGAINLNSDTITANLIATGTAPVTLAGGGTINLSDSSTNRIYAESNATGWVNEDHLIRGSGTIVNNTGSFDNRGIVQADQATPLIIDPTTGIDVLNSGIFRATSGGTLRLQNGGVNNQDGQIFIGDSSSFITSSASVSNEQIILNNLSKWQSLGTTNIIDVDTDLSSSSQVDIQGTTTFRGGSLTNPAGGVMNVDNTHYLVFGEGIALENAGDINLNSSGSSTYLSATGSTPVVLSGGGVINLSDNTANYITADSQSGGWINVDNTIHGSGTIVLNVGSFDNRSAIIADQSTPLRIDPSSSHTFLNSGTLQATNGGVLELYPGVIDSTGGQINIDAGSFLTTNGVTVSNGQLSLGNGATWDSLGTTTFSNVATTLNSASVANIEGTTIILGGSLINPLGGVINVNNADYLAFGNGVTLDNAGAINLNAINSTAFLVATGTTPVTLSGSGTINMSDSSFNLMYADSQNGGWINEDNTIRGSGTIVNGIGSFDNRGVIIADQPTLLAIDPSSSHTVLNSGTLQATNGATLQLRAGAIDNENGQIIIDQNSFLSTTGATVSNGQLTLNDNAVWNSTGTTTFNDINISLSSTSTIEVEGTTYILGGSLANPLGGIINIGNADYLAFGNGGVYSNAGSINLNGTTSTTYLVATGSIPATLSGGGTINLSDNTVNLIYSDNQSAGWINQDNVIRGSGSIVNGIGSFDNRGLILADQSTPLIIDPSTSYTFINSGILRSTAGAILELRGGGYNNADGQIVIDNDSSLRTNAAAIANGSISLGDNSHWESYGISSFTEVITTLTATSVLDITGTTTFFGGSLTNPAGGVINVENGDSLYLGGDINFVNSGSLNINATSTTTALRATGTTPISITGGGVINLSDNANNYLTSDSNNTGWINVDNTIRGSGFLINNLGSFENQALILADQSNSLIVDPSTSVAMVNTGVMRATNGGTLFLRNGEINNASGLIHVDNNSKLMLSGLTLNNGQVDAGTSAEIELATSSLNNVSLQNSTTGTITVTSGTVDVNGGNFNNPAGGVINVNNGTLLQFDEGVTLNNAGDINLNATGVGTYLRGSGASATTLQGGGVINLGDHSSNIMSSTNVNGGWINLDNTIRGSGTIIGNIGSFDNRGLILADQSTPLIIDPATSIPMLNTGILRATNGATLRITSGDVDNTDGLIDIEAGSVFTMTSASVSGGEVQLADGTTFNLSSSTLANSNFTNSASSNVIATGSSSMGGLLHNVSNAAITITNGAFFDVIGGTTLTNDGVIQLDGTTSSTYFRPSNGSITLTGSGLLQSLNDTSNRIQGAINTDELIQETEHTIKMTGFLGANLLVLRNRGLIENQASGSLTIDTTNGLDSFNSGIIRATDGGSVTLSGSQLVNQEIIAPGQLIAGASSTFQISNSAVSHGALTAQNAGTIVLINATLDDVDVTIENGGLMQVSSFQSSISNGDLLINPTGQVTLLNSGYLNLSEGATVNNQGKILIDGTTSTTRLQVDAANISLTGGGELEITNDPQNGISSTTNGNRLTNVDNHIHGGGVINDNRLLLTNRSLIEATGNLSMNLSEAGDNINTGVFLAPTGGVFDIISTLIKQDDSSGPIGVLEVSGGTFNLNNVSIFDGSFLDTGGGSFQILGSTGSATNVSSNAKLFINNGVTFALLDSYTNQSDIQLVGTTSTTTLLAGGSGGSLLLDGGGNIILDDDPQNRIIAANTGDTLVNVDNVISGAGSIGSSTLGFHNMASGVFEANGVNWFEINAHDTAGFLNEGLVTANGGHLRINDTPFTNTSGLVLAENSGVILLDGGTVLSGGNVAITDNSTLQMAGASILSGDLNIDATSQLNVTSSSNRLSGSIHNNNLITLENGTTLILDDLGVYQNFGTLQINGTTATTSLSIENTVTLDGGGEVLLNGDPQSRILGTSTTSQLINLNNTIRGGGIFGANTLNIDNRALIVADNLNTALTIDPGSGTILNSGQLRAENGGTLSLGGVIDQSAGGDIHADTGSIVEFRETSSVQAGTISGAGATYVNATTTFTDVANTSDIHISNGTSLTLNDTFDNAGNVFVNGTTGATQLRIDEEVTLFGGGNVILNGDPQSRLSGLNSTTAHLINEDNVISGGGNFGVNSVRITNRGQILINSGGASTMDWSTSGASLNPGSIDVADNNTLAINNSTIINQEDATVGHISVGDNALITTTTTTLQNGVLFAADNDFDPLTNGKFVAQGTTTLRDLTVNALYEVSNGASLILEGVIENQQELSILGNTATTTLFVGSGGATLTGGGVISLRDDPQSRISASQLGNLLVNSDNIIQGGGQIGAGFTRIQNTGTIQATGDTPLNINTSDSTFVNQGALVASGVGGLTFSESVENSGGSLNIQSLSSASVTGNFTQSNNALALIDGVLTVSGEFFNNSGALGGSGQIVGDVTSDSFISPGNIATGQLDITGNLTLSSNSAVYMEIGGVVAGTQHDVLHVTGSAILGGVISFEIISGYIPSGSDSIILLSSSFLTGNFTDLNGSVIRSLGGGWDATLNYGADSSFNPNQVTLSNFTPVPEPETYALMALGGGLIAWWWRRRRKAA
ncbi:PEP-CTERM sorting domain-containing protein [Cerasicoccus frondis]|uniref:PEP-CTERM sorting domain-containing protein n=1 Tax=Cerasicoccus frondis TaxID=490090 RepID=UPI002852908C|nr:PEP-CTERM sorting domain-containing protein [Cerasicoccus frondis]